MDIVLILFWFFAFFLAVAGIYYYFSVLPSLPKKVEVIGNSLHLKTLQREETIPIESITKLRLVLKRDKNFYLFLLYPWDLILEAFTDGIWKTIAWYPISFFIYFSFFKYPLNPTIIKEILRQNPKVELSEDLVRYMGTGYFHITKLHSEWLNKDIIYDLIGGLVIIIVFSVLFIIFR